MAITQARDIMGSIKHDVMSKIIMIYMGLLLHLMNQKHCTLMKVFNFYKQNENQSSFYFIEHFLLLLKDVPR
jgi:hypothetical protein